MKKIVDAGYYWAKCPVGRWAIIEVQKTIKGEIFLVNYCESFGCAYSLEDYTEFRGPILLEHYRGN